MNSDQASALPIVHAESLRIPPVATFGPDSHTDSLNAERAYQQPAQTTPDTTSNEYAQLKQIVKQNGLLDKQPGYYMLKIAFTCGLLALSLLFLTIIDTPWLHLLNAVFLAFVFVQLGFVGHDVGHRQVFASTWKNDLVGLIYGNLFIAVSRGWWIGKHNRHHSNPNHLDLDPDIDLPIIAFSVEQAIGMRGLPRFIVKHQALLFFPLLMIEGFYMRISSVRYLLSNRTRYTVVEALLFASHIVLYLGLLFTMLQPLQAILFILVHHALFGVYMGSVFAPNHKGMLLLDEASQLDFLRQQVLTARNVRANPLIDFWYGGLNYQIEHHLFPSMPRNNLKKAQRIVKDFCAAHAIAYYETGALQSYQEVLSYLHYVSAPLREDPA
jgi:fatty acid desaturase